MPITPDSTGTSLRRSPAPLSVESLQWRGRLRAVRVAVVLLLLTGIGVLVAPLAMGSLPIGLVGMMALLLMVPVLVWLWREPIRGLYVLLGAAIILEAQSPVYSFADDIGSNIYFFQDV